MNKLIKMKVKIQKMEWIKIVVLSPKILLMEIKQQKIIHKMINKIIMIKIKKKKKIIKNKIRKGAMLNLLKDLLSI